MKMMARQRSALVRCALLMSVAVAIGGCNLTMSDMFTDPGKYVLYDCFALKEVVKKEGQHVRKLEALMARAAKDPGGEFINLVAYRTEHLQVQGNYNLAHRNLSEKRCAQRPGRHVGLSSGRKIEAVPVERK